MKSLYISALGLLLGCAMVQGQPIVSASYNPAPGVHYTNLYQDNSLVVPSRGAAQAWNFTVSSTGSVAEVSVSAGAVATTVPAFLAADYTLTNVTTTATYYSYYKNAGTAGLFQLGFGYSGGNSVFAHAKPVLPYGLQFGQKHIYRWIEVQTGSPTVYNLTIDTVAYVGYGTLTLNGHAYPNSIYLSHHQGLYSAIGDTTQGYSFTDVLINDRIYAPGLGLPLLDRQYTAALPTATVYYLDGAPTAILPAESTPTLCWPNPSSGLITLPWQVSALWAVSATGAKTLLPFVNQQVNLSPLPPGVYMLEAERQDKRVRVVRE